MQRIIYFLAAMALTIGAVQAQSMNKNDDSKQSSPGSTGAMNNAGANGVATDPGGVKAQQGDSKRASPGTVGANPGNDPSPQNPK